MPAPLSERLDDALRPLFQADAPGAAVMLVAQGRTVFREGYGLADLASRTPIGTDMVFRLGSVSKQFTAVAALMLAQDGALDLGADITAYLPYPTRGRRITVEHLLTHTSGIADYTAMPGFEAQSGQHRTVAGMIDYFKDEPLACEPGERFEYSNSNYFLLGAIIERVSGLAFGRFLEQAIFLPLGMAHTACEGMERGPARRAAGYRQAGQGFVPCEVISMTQPYAAGALVSTLDDLARWNRALDSGILLRPESLARAFTPFVLNDGGTTGYGYGWDLQAVCGEAAQWHDGGINGYATFALRLPRQDAFIAVLSNCEDGIVAPEEAAHRMARILLD